MRGSFGQWSGQKPIVWTEEERKKGQAWGLKTIESFHTHGTPPVGE
jgi:catechol 2,3-dioxygenase